MADEVDAKAVEGNVYLLQEKANGTVTGNYKVGKAVENNFKKRMSDLQTGNPRKLDDIRKVLVSDYTAAEKGVQTALSEYKVDLGGGTEWFKAEQSELESFLNTFDETVNAYKV